MKLGQIFALGLGIIILIIIGIIIAKPNQQVANLILTGVNLCLVLGYVIATINMMRMNEIYVRELKTPVISINVGHLAMIEDENERIKNPAITLENKTKNYAKDVKLRVRALINNREFIGSYPINGEKDFYVQAGHTVIQKFKFEEEFLNRANLSIQRMKELANETNRETQFILKIKISHSDGFKKEVNLPEISWYYDFMNKAWNFRGETD